MHILLTTCVQVHTFVFLHQCSFYWIIYNKDGITCMYVKHFSFYFIRFLCYDFTIKRKSSYWMTSFLLCQLFITNFVTIDRYLNAHLDPSFQTCLQYIDNKLLLQSLPRYLCIDLTEVLIV